MSTHLNYEDWKVKYAPELSQEVIDEVEGYHAIDLNAEVEVIYRHLYNEYVQSVALMQSERQ